MGGRERYSRVESAPKESCTEWMRRMCGKLWTSCCFRGSDLERKRMEYAYEASTPEQKERSSRYGSASGSAGKAARRMSYSMAAADAIAEFAKYDENKNNSLDAEEILRMEGIDDVSSGAKERLQKLLKLFDEGYDVHEGVDREHFADLHYRMNKKCKELLAKGEPEAAKGE
jgi:hypothetical protein